MCAHCAVGGTSSPVVALTMSQVGLPQRPTPATGCQCESLGMSSGAALLRERGAESGLGEGTVTGMFRGRMLLWTTGSCWGPLGDSPEQALGCISPEAAKLRCSLLHSSLMDQGQSWGHCSLSLYVAIYESHLCGCGLTMPSCRESLVPAVRLSVCVEQQVQGEMGRAPAAPVTAAKWEKWAIQS